MCSPDVSLPADTNTCFSHQDNGVSKPSEPDKEVEQNLDDLTGNTKLWIGKDYNNFIKKDWVQLDRPFEGMLCKTLSSTHTERLGQQGAEMIASSIYISFR